MSNSLLNVEQLIERDIEHIDTQSVLSKTWRVTNKHESAYTGGKLLVTSDGNYFACWQGEQVNFVSIATGQIVHSIECGEEDAISSFAITSNNNVVFTAHVRSLQIKAWNLHDGTLIRQWKAHDMPITDMVVDPTNTLLATASVDKSVRVWDAAGGFCTHNLTGHTSMIVRLAFHVFPKRLLLCACGENGHIRMHNIRENKQHDLISHMSAVTAVGYSYCGNYLISAGRDGVWCRWDLTSMSLISTVPCFEAVEALTILPPGTTFTTTNGKTITTSGKMTQGLIKSAPTDIYFATAGDKGLIRIWNALTKRCIYTYDHAEAYKHMTGVIEEKAEAGVPSSKPPHIAFGSVLIFHPSLRPADFTPLKIAEDKDEKSVEELELEASRKDPYFPLSKPTLITLSMEQNLSFFEIATMAKRKTLVGFNDDIVDVKLIPNTRIAVVATNSPQIRFFNVDTFAAELITGHPDAVMGVEVTPCGRFMVSTSKDATMRVWLLMPVTDAISSGVGMTARCVAICRGHAEAIGALVLGVKSPNLDVASVSPAFANGPAAKAGVKQVLNYNSCSFYAITGARDRTMKVWNLAPLLCLVDPAQEKARKKVCEGNGAMWVRHDNQDVDFTEIVAGTGRLCEFVSTSTTLAHEKDINGLAVAPNDKLIASCSQDRTVKLWQLNAGTLSPVATLRGHKRGVWSVAFAPVDKVLMSTASDKTIKLWSVTDFTCVRTFQGHQSPVLRAVFIRAGLQFLSADGDGVMKLWTVKDGECVTTIDEPHDARVWGFAVGANDEVMVSGGADSRLVVWKDTTARDLAVEDAEAQARAVQEQNLVNSLRKKEWEKSFDIALTLAHPRRVYNVLNELIDAETRYKRWRHLSRKRREAKAARRLARVRAGLPDEESDQEEEFLFMEAKENLELKVPKPSTTVMKLMRNRRVEDLEKLVAYIQEWNTNGKFAYVAQYTLNALLSTISPELIKDVPRIKDSLQALQVYSQRHFTRVNTLLQSSYLIDYVFTTMNMLMPVEQVEDNGVNGINDGQGYMMSMLNLDVEDSGLEDEVVSDNDVEEVNEDDEEDDEDDENMQMMMGMGEGDEMMFDGEEDEDDMLMMIGEGDDEDAEEDLDLDEDMDVNDEDMDADDEDEGEEESEVEVPAPKKAKVDAKAANAMAKVEEKPMVKDNAKVKTREAEKKQTEAATAAAAQAETQSKSKAKKDQKSKKEEIKTVEVVAAKRSKHAEPVDDSEAEVDAIMAKLERELPTDGSKLLNTSYEPEVGKDEEYAMGDEDDAFWAGAGNWETPQETPKVKEKKTKAKKEVKEKKHIVVAEDDKKRKRK